MNTINRSNTIKIGENATFVDVSRQKEPIKIVWFRKIILFDFIMGIRNFINYLVHETWTIFRLNADKFQNFSFLPVNFIFWVKITLEWISRFLQIHPIYDFCDFPENVNFDNGYFRENFWKSYIGWIRKNLEINPSYHFCEFPSKMANYT